MHHFFLLPLVICAANKVLDGLRRTQAGLNAEKNSTRKRKSKEEVSRLFQPNNKCSKLNVSEKKCVWKHRFMCLAFRDQTKIPTTDYQKDDLLEAGLGEKEVEFSTLELNADQFKEKIYSVFPKLKDAGGFQFCKCKPNSRAIEPLSKHTHSSPAMLKERAGKSRTYIRPIQRDLDMEAIFDLPEGVRFFFISRLRVVPRVMHWAVGYQHPITTFI